MFLGLPDYEYLLILSLDPPKIAELIDKAMLGGEAEP